MTDGEPETVVSASLQKIESTKNPIKHLYFLYFIKSETSDSFVIHFDGHFDVYLKTLDFYFKTPMSIVMGPDLRHHLGRDLRHLGRHLRHHLGRDFRHLGRDLRQLEEGLRHTRT